MAQNIWDDAYRNTLDKRGRIERYLSADTACINKVGGQHTLTPLAGACHQGHVNIVNLLIAHGARADIVCPGSRTALYYAIAVAPHNQLAIVMALLTAPDGPADPNEVYPLDGNANPLTLAIEEARDREIVRVLIEAGAIPTAVNRKQAKAKDMEQYLVPSNKAHSSQTQVDLIVAAVSLILGYTDGGAFGSVTKGFLSKMYRITNPNRNPVGIDVPVPKSTQDFKHNINNFVKTAGLDKFYTRNPDFIQSLAEKASELRDNPDTDLGKPENLKRLTQLSLYQLVIYCDDSSSMDSVSATDMRHTRYHTLRKLVERISRVATSLLPADTKLHVRFINNHFRGDVTAADVPSLMGTVHPSGSTPLGENLVAKILRPLVYEKIAGSNYEFERPLLICTITDGAPDQGDIPIKDAVVECRRALVDKEYDPASVMFCISQIGGDVYAQSFLDDVRREVEIQDVVYCTTDQLDVKFAELRENERQLEVWLLEMLTKPLMRG